MVHWTSGLVHHGFVKKNMIRLVTITDSPRISEIYRYYVENTTITFDEKTPTAETMAAKIAAVSSMYPWIVLEERGTILGYAYISQYRPHTAYRWSVEDSVYLDPGSRGRGLGTQLLSVLIRLARLQSLATMYAVIAAPNPESVHLHEKFGFKPLCRFSHTAFKHGSWQSIDWMELPLQPPSSFAPGVVPVEPLPFPTLMEQRPDDIAAILGG